MLTHFGLHIHDRFYPRHKPWIDVAKGINLLLVEAEAQSLGHLQNAVRRRCAERGANDVLVVALPKPLQRIVVEAGEPRLHGPQRFLELSSKVRPIAMTSPTDFIDVVSVAGAPGNFSKAKRGILVTM